MIDKSIKTCRIVYMEKEEKTVKVSMTTYRKLKDLKDRTGISIKRLIDNAIKKIS